MLDFVLSIFSSALQMDMRDHHDIPFALPIVMAVVIGGLFGTLIIRFIGNEREDVRNAREEREIAEGRRFR
jgi:hypothetical protein